MSVLRYLTIIVGTGLIVSSCANSEAVQSFGECVDAKIKEFKEAKVKNPPASIYQYTYKGETVYYIPPYCCDNMGVLINNSCEVVCNPDGGFTGQGDGKCTDFVQERQAEKLLWKDDRTEEENKK